MDGATFLHRFLAQQVGRLASYSERPQQGAAFELLKTADAVCSALVAVDALEIQFAQEPAWAWWLEDDAGTMYQHGGGSAGGGVIWTEEWHATPAPPSEATTLTLVALRIDTIRNSGASRHVWGRRGPAGREITRLDVPLR